MTENDLKPGRRAEFGFQRATEAISALCMLAVFALFVIGIGMRYLANRPLAWIDEAVTLLSVWGTFWTAAFVLKWPEHIAFDVVFSNLRPGVQRWSLLVGSIGFVVLMGAALPGLVDYTLFLWRERTDAMQLRLDWVYSIFPIFFVVVLVRLAWSLRQLASPGWKDELARWTGHDPEAER
jgi:TRAP-type C4-dicarboxylate transport system permease small subunit